MKLLNACAAALSVLSLQTAVYARGIVWAPNLKVAQTRAEAGDKTIMVDFYTSWCVWCKALDKKVYPDPRVAAAAEPFVPVKLNAEREGERLAGAFGVTSFPTILFFDPEGGYEGGITTYAPAPIFAEMLRDMHGRILAYHSLEAQVAQNPNDPRLTAHLAAAFAERRRTDDAIQQASLSEASGGSNELAFAFNAIGDSLLQNDDHVAANYYQKALKIGASPDDRISAYLGLGQVSADRNDRPGVIYQLKSALAIPNLTRQDRVRLKAMLKMTEGSK